MAHGHAHTHEHGHAHGHALPAPEQVNKAFIIGIALNLIFVLVEAAAGFWYDSLALLSDAGHNLSDVISLVLALLAFRMAKVKPNSRYTYGYKKSTVLVSLLNAIILLVAVGIILAESIEKLRNPQPIAGGVIAWVAGVGILINAFTAFLFLKDKERDLNIKGAYLHLMADALVSVGVVISGVIISYTNWYIIDPIIGIAIAIVILVSTWNLLRDSLRLSLDGVPAGISAEKIRKLLLQVDGVREIHHLHIWALSTTQNALTAHVVVASLEDGEAVKNRIKEILSEEHIPHATLELETVAECCTDRTD